MAQKSNIRSMRFSDEMISMIEQQAGDTFTAKFESLVTRCMWELPQKEKELQFINQRIEKERQRLYAIQKKCMELERVTYKLYTSIHQYESNVNYTIKQIENQLDKP